MTTLFLFGGDFMKEKERVMYYVALLTLIVMVVAMVHFVSSQQEVIMEYERLADLNQSDYDHLVHEYIERNREVEVLKATLDEVQRVAIPSYAYTVSEVETLAKCAQCEAGYPPRAPVAFKWVVKTVLNRVADPAFPDTIEGVIYQKVGNTPQFSVAYNGMMDNCELSMESLLQTYEVLLFGSDLPDYVEYFFEESVSGKWVNTLPIYKTVDGTTFAYEERS